MAKKENKYSIEPPKVIPEKIKGTLRSFKDVDSFFSYWSSIPISSESIPRGGSHSTYADLYNWLRQYNNDGIKNDSFGSYDKVQWLGEPALSSFEEAIERTRYQNMDDFKQVYENSIAPRIQEILRQSSADLEIPVMKYNDLGLGTFDFNKASTGLVPLYKYYSFELKEIVDGKLVDTYKDGDTYKYRLITDGSPVVLIPSILNDDDKELVDKAYKEIYKGGNPFEVLKKYGLKIGGQNAFTSTVKKTFVLKEKFPKPKNAVRIFIKLGANNNIVYPAYKWTGYAAVGIAELLDTIGYATSIIAVEGTQSNFCYDLKIDNQLQNGVRFWGIVLKTFEQTLDKSSLLYLVSDPSFFRIKVFDAIVKQAQFYGDKIGDCLGSSAYKPAIEQMVWSEYGKRDKMFYDSGKSDPNSQFLYYILSDIYSEEDMNTAIRDIGLDVVNKNKEARERIYGLMYQNQ